MDTVIAIPNDRLLALVPRGTSFFEAFKVADDLLRQAVQGISDIIITPGLINRDFSDIKATMVGMGYAMMGTAIGTRRKRRRGCGPPGDQLPAAGRLAHLRSRGILINITGSSRLGLHEVNEACSIIREAADCDDVQINFGVILNESLADAVKITVIATGFQPENAPVPERRRARRGSPVIRVPVQHRLPEPEPEPVRNPRLVGARTRAGAEPDAHGGTGADARSRRSGHAGLSAAGRLLELNVAEQTNATAGLVGSCPCCRARDRQFHRLLSRSDLASTPPITRAVWAKRQRVAASRKCITRPCTKQRGGGANAASTVLGGHRPRYPPASRLARRPAAATPRSSG